MQSLISFFLMPLMVLMLNTQVLAASAPADKLSQLLGNMQTLDADFQQRILDAKGSRLQEVTGHLSLARPGQFYWQTETPFPQTVVSDGETLWLYDPDLEQVSIRPVSSARSRTPAMLLSGDVASIEEEFAVTLTRDTAQVKEFLLKPKGQESLFEELRLTFISGELSSLLLADSLGQRTSIELFDTRMNPDLPEKRFRFEIPEGIDVIQQ